MGLQGLPGAPGADGEKGTLSNYMLFLNNICKKKLHYAIHFKRKYNM